MLCRCIRKMLSCVSLFLLILCIFFLLPHTLNNQDTRLCVSGQEDEKRYTAHKCVTYQYSKIAKFTLVYLQNYILSSFLPNLYIYALHTYTLATLHIKIEKNCFKISQDICYWKLPLFICIFLCTKLQIYLSLVKIISYFDFFYIWHTNNAHFSLHFPKTLRNFTGCSINNMDLKIFPNTNMLLKVDHFEGFFNWNNVDKLVIYLIVRVDVTVTITDLTITYMKTVFSYSKRFLI